MLRTFGPNTLGCEVPDATLAQWTAVLARARIRSTWELQDIVTDNMRHIIRYPPLAAPTWADPEAESGSVVVAADAAAAALHVAQQRVRGALSADDAELKKAVAERDAARSDRAAALRALVEHASQRQPAQCADACERCAEMRARLLRAEAAAEVAGLPLDLPTLADARGRTDAAEAEAARARELAAAAACAGAELERLCRPTPDALHPKK
eukprot:gene34329-17542_t